MHQTKVGTAMSDDAMLYNVTRMEERSTVPQPNLLPDYRHYSASDLSQPLNATASSKQVCPIDV